MVTGDVDGDVIIWDPVTGMRALQFTAYQSSTEWERKVDNSVTAMCFDETKRQLATGNTQVTGGVGPLGWGGVMGKCKKKSIGGLWVHMDCYTNIVKVYF